VASFVIRRCLSAVIAILAVVVFVTVLASLIPGDTAHVILGPRATPDLVAKVRSELHLDESLPHQVSDFVVGAMHGDLGTDIENNVPVTTLFSQALPDTMILTITSLTLAVAVGIPLGVASAARRGSWYDRVTGAMSVGLISVPAYVVALALVVAFSVQLRLLPGIGTGTLSDPVDYGSRLLLPAVSLAVGWIGYLARLVRSSMLEELSSEYVRNARSFGLSERTILYRYALRNALVPVVAVVGSALGYLLASTVLIESIFNRQGLGFLLVDGVQTREWAVVRDCALVFALVFIVGNLLAEIAVRLLDPRVELGRGAT
jgi:peptide/nickel transport system permease protein